MAKRKKIPGNLKAARHAVKGEQANANIAPNQRKSLGGLPNACEPKEKVQEECGETGPA